MPIHSFFKATITLLYFVMIGWPLVALVGKSLLNKISEFSLVI